MAVTKYVPQHFAGVRVDDAPQIVFQPGVPVGAPPVTPHEEILTGVVIVNGGATAGEFSLHYLHNASSIYLFKQLLLPSHSTTNLDLYLPLVPGQNLIAVASVADEVSLTLYGLRLVEL